MKHFTPMALIVLLGACQGARMPGAPDGAQLFADNCVACHGADAKGAGPETLGLGKVPPDLTTLAARHGGVFPQVAVLSIIDGYRQGAHADRIMPEFGVDLGGDLVPLEIDRQLTPVPRDLAALLAYLEAIQTAP